MVMKPVSVTYVSTRDQLVNQVRTHVPLQPTTALAYLDRYAGELLSPRDRAILTSRAVRSLTRKFQPDVAPGEAIREVREARYYVSGLAHHADADLAALETHFFAELVLRQAPRISRPAKDGTAEDIVEEARQLAAALRDSTDLRGDATPTPFDGVGLRIGEDDQGRFVVTQVIQEGPAHRAGVLPGDVLLGVNRNPIDQKLYDEVHAALLGPRGTKVTLTLIRPQWEDPLEVEVVRDTVFGKEKDLLQALDKVAAAAGKLASYEKFRAALARVRGKGVAALKVRALEHQRIEIVEQLATHEGKLTNVTNDDRREHPVTLRKGAYFFQFGAEVVEFGVARHRADCWVRLEDSEKRIVSSTTWPGDGPFQIERDGKYWIVVVSGSRAVEESSRFRQEMRYGVALKRSESFAVADPGIVTQFRGESDRHFRRMSAVSDLRDAAQGDIEPATYKVLPERLKVFRDLGGNSLLADRLGEELAVRALLGGHFKEARLLVPQGGPSEHAGHLLRDIKAILTGKGEVVTEPGRKAVEDQAVADQGGGKRRPPPGRGLLVPENPGDEWKPRVKKGVLAGLPPLSEEIGRQQRQWQQELLKEPIGKAEQELAEAGRTLDALLGRFQAQADRLVPIHQALAFRLQQPLTVLQKALARDRAFRGQDAETVVRELQAPVPAEEGSIPVEVLDAARLVGVAAIGCNVASGLTPTLEIASSLSWPRLVRAWAKTVKLN